MQTIILSFLLYCQNFFIVYISDKFFEPNIFEYLLILTILILVQTSKYKTIILILWQILYCIEFLFISYFNSTIKPYDIKLFFTHSNEIFESFINLYHIFIPSIIFCTIMVIFIIKLSHKINISRYFIIFILSMLIFFQPKTQNDLSLNLIQNIFNISFLANEPLNNSNKLNPHHKINNLNIVLVVAESMRYKNLSLFGYKKNTTPYLNNLKTDLFYKTVYTKATNTDVSIPLLINGANDFENIDISNNLFVLASNNNFYTSFISTQSPKSLQYIMPYLSDSINNIKILNSKNDEDLYFYLKKDYQNNSNNFTVLQMTGEHSPYSYYPKSFNIFTNNSIENNYNNSIRYSDYVLNLIIQYIKKQDKPTIFICTSDHGELLGENNQYGHNRFEKDIYTVPLIIYTHNIKIDKNILKNINSHQDIYTFIKYLLGYSQTINFVSAPYRINGTMQTGEDSYILVN